MLKIKSLALCLVAVILCLFTSCNKEEKQKEKEILMWFDATGNFERFGNPDSIDYYLEKIKSLGFTHAVVDVRPIAGEVLYPSKVAKQMIEYRGVTRDKDFDFLQHFIDKAHSIGLEVHASLNVFVAGHNYIDRGPIFEDHPEWASIVYRPEKGFVPITDEKYLYSAMTNPIHPGFQKHILDILREVTTNYPKLDGLILDRVRYDGVSADFSDLSRTEFEKYANLKIERFPEDIFEWVKDDEGKYVRKNGIHFNKWAEWRAKNIYDFMALARKEVKAINPNISFGTYTGAWYPSYYEVGVNFASRNFDPSKYFDWATPEYKNFGYAELLDLYTTGNYYTDISLEDRRANPNSVWNETDSEAQSGDWYCVEGSCDELRKILGDRTFSGGLLADQFYNKREDLTRSIEMNLAKSDGLMIFDIVHIINKDMWKEVETGMRNAGVIE